MSESHGKFVWYDLMTTDEAAAASLYSAVFDWAAKDSGMSDRVYTLLFAGPVMVAGRMKMPQGLSSQDSKPAWLGHIGVDDVDLYAERVTAAGGAIHRAPEDIPGIGRFAVASDPMGRPFSCSSHWRVQWTKKW